jgi:hypothetical protein
MKSIVKILWVLVLFSCNHKPFDRDYQSIDLNTGGFNNFSLHLDSKGILKLVLTTSTPDKEDNDGSTWSSKSQIIYGKWNLNDEKIEFSLEKSKSEIDKLFNGTDWKELAKYPVLTFSHSSDTAYIYSIPCVLTKK